MALYRDGAARFRPVARHRRTPVALAVATTNGLETGLGWLNVTSVRSLLLLTRQAEPPTLVTNESDCYHFCVLNPPSSAQ